MSVCTLQGEDTKKSGSFVYFCRAKLNYMRKIQCLLRAKIHANAPAVIVSCAKIVHFKPKNESFHAQGMCISCPRNGFMNDMDITRQPSVQTLMPTGTIAHKLPTVKPNTAPTCPQHRARMINEQFPSKLLERAVQELTRLPGVGRKTALRFALYLLAQDKDTVHAFSDSLTHLCDDVKHCKVCHNISDTEVCDICANPRRDKSTICVVENIHSVMSIENTGQFHGLYHVLGGVISPMDGTGPSDLELESLFSRVEAGGIEEIILALNPTMEGDTTNFYISRRLAKTGVKFSILARGVSVGDDLEYTDEITLGRSILGRTPLK